VSVGSEEIIIIRTTVNPGTTGTIINTVSVSSDLLDPNPENNQVTEETTITEPVNDITLVSIIRDFSHTHPDMQQGCGGGICNGVKPGLVKDDIGLDDKPIFNQDIDSTNGAVNFNQWYNHIPFTNQCIDYDLVLEFDETASTYSFLNGGISGGFFPIDDFGFGNQGFTDGNGIPHNFHFTLQAKGTFDHLSGQFFEIGGADDDVFVFINGKLAIDLGGTHPASQASASIDLDNPSPSHDDLLRHHQKIVKF